MSEKKITDFIVPTIGTLPQDNVFAKGGLLFDIGDTDKMNAHVANLVKRQQKAQIIDLLKNLRDGMAVFAAYAQHNKLDEEQERMYKQLVDWACACVEALGLPKVVEMADITSMDGKVEC